MVAWSVGRQSPKVCTRECRVKAKGPDADLSMSNLIRAKDFDFACGAQTRIGATFGVARRRARRGGGVARDALVSVPFRAVRGGRGGVA